MPSVVHVFDMIVERHVDFNEGRAIEIEVERKRVSIEGATHLIAISDATARDLEYFYPRVRGRVTTVHLCANHLSARPEPVSPAPPEPYALYVGDRHFYRNFGAVLDAIESPRRPNAVGPCVAGLPWRANEALRVERLSTTRRIQHAGGVNDAQLAWLHRGASCLVVSAIAEGFRLPIVEAQQASAPVACSDIAVFREVAGAGALFFDPHRAEQLAERVAEAMDPGARAADHRGEGQSAALFLGPQLRAGRRSLPLDRRPPVVRLAAREVAAAPQQVFGRLVPGHGPEILRKQDPGQFAPRFELLDAGGERFGTSRVEIGGKVSRDLSVHR
jgi:glycosyltransferase involved in cell wall biosynthesis